MLNVAFINLWCTKNLVDTQFVLWKLFADEQEKVNFYSDAFDKSVDVVFLNTCGFI